jgi:hypothetical protein
MAFVALILRAGVPDPGKPWPPVPVQRPHFSTEITEIHEIAEFVVPSTSITGALLCAPPCGLAPWHRTVRHTPRRRRDPSAIS